MITGGLPTIVDAMRMNMPSKSKAQEKLMNIAAHTKGGYGGVPQSVGKEFHGADKHVGKFKKHHSPTQKEGIRKMYTNS